VYTTGHLKSGQNVTTRVETTLAAAKLLVIIEVKYVLAIGYDQEREEFVIRLYKENKSIREIAKLNYRYRSKHALFVTGT
jgi:hypothetical protein